MRFMVDRRFKKVAISTSAPLYWQHPAPLEKRTFQLLAGKSQDK
jgi:hypothetical protein